MHGMTALEKARQILEAQSTDLLGERAIFYMFRFPGYPLTKLMLDIIMERSETCVY